MSMSLSQPRRARALLVLAFVLALAAGIAVGAGLARTSFANDPGAVKPSPGPSPAQWNPFADQLKLTADQRKQFDEIWRDAPHGKMRELSDSRRRLFKEREEALARLVTPEQKADRERVRREFGARIDELERQREEAVAKLYTPEQVARREAIKKEYEARIADASRQRDQLFQPIVERSRVLLSEEQRRKFDEMMARGGGGDDRGRGHRGGGGPPTRPGADPAPATRPSPDFGEGRHRP